ncbi:MAG: hypothetical protein U0797_03505 [Gemmataceae bacterium]
MAWGHAAGVSFAVMVVGVQVLLPAYNHAFSPRSQLRHLAGEAERAGRPVVCYPQMYESASFYLPGGQVRAFGPAQRRELIDHLCAHPGTLLLVKSGPALDRLLAELPPWVEFRPWHRRGPIQVGRVVARRQPVGPLLAWEGAGSD